MYNRTNPKGQETKGHKYIKDKMDNITPPKNSDFNTRLPGILDSKAISRDDIDVGQVVKRTERISSALYLVTGFFPEGDPLTFRLREVSVSLLSLMSHFILESRRGVIGKSKEAHRMIIELVSLLDTARLAGFVSEMNFNIISDEIEKVVLALRTIVNAEGTSVLIDKHFFAIPEVVTPSQNDQSSQYMQSKPSSSAVVHNKGSKKAVISRSSEREGSVDIKRKSRRESILSVIKKLGEVGIKEISNTVKDCSEKTIQRELTSLVAEGVLKKRGERRWSTYALS